MYVITAIMCCWLIGVLLNLYFLNMGAYKGVTTNLRNAFTPSTYG